jgi:phage-related holin
LISFFAAAVVNKDTVMVSAQLVIDNLAHKRQLTVPSAQVYWIVAETVSIGVGANIQGNILSQVNISMVTNASVIDRLLAQTAITLDSNSVIKSS